MPLSLTLSASNLMKSIIVIKNLLLYAIKILWEANHHHRMMRYKKEEVWMRWMVWNEEEFLSERYTHEKHKMMKMRREEKKREMMMIHNDEKRERIKEKDISLRMLSELTVES